jgi:hypothetical protein
VDHRAGLDYLENKKFLTLPGLELRPLSRPARSQSLYRLRYPGSFLLVVFAKKIEGLLSHKQMFFIIDSQQVSA